MSDPVYDPNTDSWSLQIYEPDTGQWMFSVSIDGQFSANDRALMVDVLNDLVSFRPAFDIISESLVEDYGSEYILTINNTSGPSSADVGEAELYINPSQLDEYVSLTDGSLSAIPNIARVIAHETLHMFGTVDVVDSNGVAWEDLTLSQKLALFGDSSIDWTGETVRLTNNFMAEYYGSDPRGHYLNAEAGVISGLFGVTDFTDGNPVDMVITGSLLGGEDTTVIRAGAVNDSGQAAVELILGGSGEETVTVSPGGSYVWTSGGNDTVYGLDGVDVVHAGAGDDIVIGNGEADELYGDDGDDFITGDAGADSLYGGSGADNLDGGDGADTLHGGDGGDNLVGGGGSDTLEGQGGNDALYGGGGSDDFVFRVGYGIDTVYDFEAIGPNADTLSINYAGYNSVQDMSAVAYNTPNGLAFYFSVDDSITLVGLTTDALASIDFDFL